MCKGNDRIHFHGVKPKGSIARINDDKVHATSESHASKVTTFITLAVQINASASESSHTITNVLYTNFNQIFLVKCLNLDQLK